MKNSNLVYTVHKETFSSAQHAALDRMVAAGVLPPARRPGAEYLAWSAVHGLAVLIIDWPLLTRPARRCAPGTACGDRRRGWRTIRW